METQSFQPEEIKSSEYTPYLLPTFKGHEDIEQQIAKEKELLRQLPQKMEFINQIPEEKMHNGFKLAKAELNRAYERFKNRLEGITDAPSTREGIIREFGDQIESTDDEEVNSRELGDLIKNIYKSAKSDVIFLCTSHADTYYEIEQLRGEAVEASSLAVVVFDNHPDVFYKPEEKRVVAESNVFLALTGNGLINGAVIIGPQAGEHVIPDANKVMNGALKKHNKNAEEQIWFIGIDKRTLEQQEEETGESRSEALESQITKMVDSLRKDGITNIVFSIDIDFLNSSRIGYTGFQYNPTQLLSELAKIEFADVDPQELTEVEIDGVFLELMVGLDKVFKKRDEGATEDELTEYIETEMWHHPIRSNYETKAYDPQTLTMGDVGRSIDQIVKECKMAGIQVGVKLKSGGRYVGDVVGFEGKDYKGMTARATKALTDRLAKAVR